MKKTIGGLCSQLWCENYCELDEGGDYDPKSADLHGCAIALVVATVAVDYLTEMLNMCQ